MSVFKYEKDADGIVTVTMDQTGPVNAMNEEYRQAMAETVDKLEGETGLVGVVFASAKKVFFAGGDLNELLAAQKGDEAQFMELMAIDKKVLNGELRLVLLKSIGKAVVTGDFKAELLSKTLTSAA